MLFTTQINNQTILMRQSFSWWGNSHWTSFFMHSLFHQLKFNEVGLTFQRFLTHPNIHDIICGLVFDLLLWI